MQKITDVANELALRYDIRYDEAFTAVTDYAARVGYDYRVTDLFDSDADVIRGAYAVYSRLN